MLFNKLYKNNNKKNALNNCEKRREEKDLLMKMQLFYSINNWKWKIALSLNDSNLSFKVKAPSTMVDQQIIEYSFHNVSTPGFRSFYLK